MKIAYIAHPVGGDVKTNIERILEIVRLVNLTEPDVEPFVPYLADIMAMDDSNPDQRKRGMKNNEAMFGELMIDELRLYGDRISEGMKTEIQIAVSCGIPVKVKSQQIGLELLQPYLEKTKTGIELLSDQLQG